MGSIRVGKFPLQEQGGLCNKEREFIKVIAGSAVAWPLAARAQVVMPAIGSLHSATLNSYAREMEAFHRGLSDVGQVQGKTVAVEYRWAENDLDRLPGLAADLVQRRVAVIFAGGAVNTAVAAKSATSKIPIVFACGSDPVKLGLIDRLNRPDSNITGVFFLATALGEKRLDLLNKLVPKAEVISVLLNPKSGHSEMQLKDVQGAARTLGLRLNVLHAQSEREFDAAFETLELQQAGALVIAADALFYSNYGRLVALAARHSVPTIYAWREAVVAGGLISYGTSLPDAYRQAGQYVGRILKGEKIADLPVQQSAKVELVINLKTAKTLGLDFPLSLLGGAAEVVE